MSHTFSRYRTHTWQRRMGPFCLMRSEAELLRGYFFTSIWSLPFRRLIAIAQLNECIVDKTNRTEDL